MKSLEDLRKMTKKDLEAEVFFLRKEQFKLRLKRANGELDKTHKVKSLRRSIARIKTIMVEKAE